jgi:hypothetical protein
MIHIDTRDAIKAMKTLKSALTGRQRNKAIALAFNDAMKLGRRELGKEVRKEYTVKLSGISKATRLQRATLNKQFAVLTTVGKPLPLERFSVRPIKSGLSIQVIKGKRNIVRSAFMQKIKRKRAFARGEYKSGGGFQFRNKRVTKTGNDLPMNNLLGPSLPSMIGSDATNLERSLGTLISDRADEKLIDFFNKIDSFYS